MIKGGIESEAEVHFLEEVTIEIPSVESEWVVGREIHHHWCVRIALLASVCTCMWSPLLQFLLLGAHTVIDGERNAAHQRSSSSLT